MAKPSSLNSRFSDYSLRKKLVLFTMFATLLTLLLTLSAIISLDRMLTTQNMVKEVSALSKVIAARSEVAVRFGDRRNSQSNLDALKNSPEYVLGCLYGLDRATEQQVLLGQFPKASASLFCPAETPKDLTNFTPVTGAVIHQWTPIASSQDKVIGYLYLQRSLSSLNQRLKQFTLASAGISFFFLVIGSLVIARLQRIISQPILDLSNISTQIAKDNDYQRRATVNSTDEVGALGVAFNKMLDTIEKTQSDLSFMAYYDALTGLPNRRFFMETLGTQMTSVQRGHRSITLLLIDLDGFKGVNDTIGHDAGDMVLTTVSERMPKLLRKGDMVARLGGDEFTIILRDVVAPEALRKMALDLIHAIEEPILFKNQNADVSASVGIATAPNDATSMDVLLKYADAAMYRAKAGGKKTFYFYDADIDVAMKHSMKQELRLHSALLHQRTHLLYQPFIELENSNTIGFMLTLKPFDTQESQQGVNAASKYHVSLIRHLTDDSIAHLLLSKMIEALQQDTSEITHSLESLRKPTLVLPVSQANLRQKDLLHQISMLTKQLNVNGFDLKLTLNRMESENPWDQQLEAPLALQDDGDGIENFGSIESLGGSEGNQSWCFATIPEQKLSDWSSLAWTNLLHTASQEHTKLIGFGVHSQEQLQLCKKLGIQTLCGDIISKPLSVSELSSWAQRDVKSHFAS